MRPHYPAARRTVLFVTLLLVAAGCATQPSPVTAPTEALPAGTVAGNWIGSLTSGPYVSELEMLLEQTGNVITGTHSIRHAIGGHTTSGWIKGTIKGRAVSLNTQHAHFSLMVSEDGQLLQGDGRSSVYFTVELKRKP